MMLYGLKKNNEIGMSEWDILPPGNDMWREPLRTKWGFNVNRKIIKVNGGIVQQATFDRSDDYPAVDRS